MGVALIENPTEAFSSAGQDNYPVFTNQLITLPCSAVITAGNLVEIVYNATGNPVTVAPVTATSPLNAIGVAIQTTTAVGQLCEVCVSGIAQVLCSTGTFAPGAAFSSAATGIPTTASTTLGANVGVFLATTTASVLNYAFIQKF